MLHGPFTVVKKSVLRVGHRKHGKHFVLIFILLFFSIVFSFFCLFFYQFFSFSSFFSFFHVSSLFLFFLLREWCLSPLFCKAVLLGVLLPLEWCCCFFLFLLYCCLRSPPLGVAAFSISSVGWCCLVSSFLWVVLLFFLSCLVVLPS